MNVDLKALEQFYFEGMLAGFLGDAPRKDVEGKPGFRRIEYEKDEYRMVDEYLKTLGTACHSSGQIVIWQGETPVWTIGYSGRFDREALPVIKAALRKAFVDGKFFNGRGPQHFNLGKLSYENSFGRWSFENFDGSESVYEAGDNQGKRWLGSQTYHGRTLVPLK